MRVLFDTSTLVAAMVSRHPRHKDAQPELERALDGGVTGLVSTHSLAEVFAVLTRLPLKPAIGPKTARMLLEANLQGFEVVPLDGQDYFAVISRLEALQFTGGAIYDALIAQAALKANADELLTFNPAHFTRLGPDVTALVREP